MGVAQETMFSISDRLAKFFGISGAPMEYNAIAKPKQTFFLQISHKRPQTISAIRHVPIITLHTYVTVTKFSALYKFTNIRGNM